MHGNRPHTGSATKISDLVELGATFDDQETVEKIPHRNPMRIPPYYQNLIDWDDPDDPIRKMSVPSALEDIGDGELDTSGESTNTKIRSLQHKYSETALILSTHECAMYCRFCFRKRLVGREGDETIGQGDFDKNIKYIHDHPEITNVLISGGDPFTLKPQRRPVLAS